ncbi:hypothetical protein LCGC14_2056080, partial [marine sediment metagenome]
DEIYSVLYPGYNYWGPESGYTRWPTGTYANDEFLPSSNPHTYVDSATPGSYIYSTASYGGEWSYGYIRPDSSAAQRTEQWNYISGDPSPHARWLDEAVNGAGQLADLNGDGGEIVTNIPGGQDEWDFTNNVILLNSYVSKIVVSGYVKGDSHNDIVVETSFGNNRWTGLTSSYQWKSFTLSGLVKWQSDINSFIMKVIKTPDPAYPSSGLAPVYLEAVHVQVFLKTQLGPDAAIEFDVNNFPTVPHGYRVLGITVQVLARANFDQAGTLEIYRGFPGYSAVLSTQGVTQTFAWHSFGFSEFITSQIYNLRIKLHWAAGLGNVLNVDEVRITAIYRPLIHYQRFQAGWDIPLEAAIISQLDYRFKKVCAYSTISNLQIWDGSYSTIATTGTSTNWLAGSESLSNNAYIQDNFAVWVNFDSIDYYDYDDFKLYLDQLGVRYYLGDRHVYNNEIIYPNTDWTRNYTSTGLIEHGRSDDPFFGKNNYQYTMGNSLITPIFGRDGASAFTDINLTDVDFGFEVYSEDGYSGYILENPEIEGRNQTKYNHTILTDYTEYSQSKFKNTAIDDIQIPLITPIEVDCGSITAEEFSDLDLEIALNLDIDLANRLSDVNWSFRFRLVYYNYTSGGWEDFKGLLKAENNGVERTVWNSDSRDFIEQLQDLRANYFLPLTNENNIVVQNPILIDNIDGSTISNGIMKLALISYILHLS